MKFTTKEPKYNRLTPIMLCLTLASILHIFACDSMEKGSQLIVNSFVATADNLHKNDAKMLSTDNVTQDRVKGKPLTKSNELQSIKLPSREELKLMLIGETPEQVLDQLDMPY